MREEPQTPFQIVADPVLHAACIALTRTYIEDRPVISSWNSLIDYCRVCLAYQPREQLHLLFLNRRNVLIADETQQVGSIDHTPTTVRIRIMRAVLSWQTAGCFPPATERGRRYRHTSDRLTHGICLVC